MTSVPPRVRNGVGSAAATAPTKRKRPAPRVATGAEAGPTTPQLVIDCKYANTLPQPPVPKLLKALPNAERFFQYRPTQLELDHRPFLLSEKDLLSCIEFVDPDAYGDSVPQGSMPPPLPPQDAVLLRDDDVTEKIREQERKRRKLCEATEAFHREAFGLQLPQLVSNDTFTERQRFITGMDAAEKKIHREPPGYNSVEELVSKVENTFEFAKQPPVHPTNPALKPKKVLSIVPDAVLWANRYRQMNFDELPMEPQQNDILFKTVPTPRATCFGLFSASGGDGTGQQGSYKLAQSYIWDNRGHFTRAISCGEGESMLLSFPPDDDEVGEVRFVIAPTLMKLKKQKAARLDLGLDASSLSVTHREPSAQEQAEERDRMATVLSDEAVEREDSTFDYVDGEWLIRGDPRPNTTKIPTQTPPLTTPPPVSPGSKVNVQSRSPSPRSRD
eukprot:TRINITY_DN68147_c0_g1_i1.p1 TRINITY_DN68147_c0_g1~~TRINITY_DN68147_c0_g1_i1.p1  ORF type:complete len:445 (-),score=89.45 TRINITY_DN68147_c0_g1_i1:217-1551(-)